MLLRLGWAKWGGSRGVGWMDDWDKKEKGREYACSDDGISVWCCPLSWYCLMHSQVELKSMSSPSSVYQIGLSPYMRCVSTMTAPNCSSQRRHLE